MSRDPSALCIRGYGPARRDSAAMSIAANRLSKIRLLLGDNTDRCDVIARRFAVSLARDIDAHLERFPKTSEQAACVLREQRDLALDETETKED